MITAVPEIHEYPLSETTDYIIMGSDGIFDHLSNQ